MVSPMFSVFDVRANVFQPPVARPNDAVAMRDFEQSVKDANGVMAKFPEDFSLFCVGYWNDETGAMQPLADTRRLAHALDVARKVLVGAPVAPRVVV